MPSSIRLLIRPLWRSFRRNPSVSAIAFRIRRNRWRAKGTDNVAEMGEARVQRVRFDICGARNHITVGARTALRNSEAFIRGNGNKILIGESCRIEGASFWIEDDSCQIRIGRATTFERSIHLAATENASTISIGDDCMFAYDVEVRTGDSHSIIDIASNSRINPAASVVIGDHVWIGPRVTILKGVKVGSGSIIGSGSCVTRSVPENSMVAGVPATVRRQGVQWLRERI